MSKRFTLKPAKGWEDHDINTPLTAAQIAEIEALGPPIKGEAIKKLMRENPTLSLFDAIDMLSAKYRAEGRGRVH